MFEREIQRERETEKERERERERYKVLQPLCCTRPGCRNKILIEYVWLLDEKYF